MQRARSLAAWAFLGLFLAAVVVLTSTVASAVTPTTGRNYDPYNISQAADCSATNAPFKRICHETADDSAWFCELETGCLSNGTGWVQIGGGNAATATALAANGANCSAGNYPLGVDASGAAESCTAVSSAVPHWDFAWAAATTADDFYVKVSGGSITLTALDCVATGSTTPSAFLITVAECDSNATNCVDTTGTATLSALVTNSNDTSFTDAAIDDDDWVGVRVTSLTTAPDYAFCRLEYTQP